MTVPRLVGLGSSTALDGVASLVTDLLDTPISLVTVLGAEHEFVLGADGVEGTALADQHAVPTSASLCVLVREAGGPVAIDDLAADDRFVDHPAAQHLGLRSYLGAPITDDHGEVLGSVCAGGPEARRWSDDDLRELTAVARFVERQLSRIVDTHDAVARAEELGLVVGRLRHELSGDLTVVLGGIETALHPRIDEHLRERVLERARGDALRVIDVMDALLRTDRRTSVRPALTSMRRVCEDAVRPVRREHQGRVEVHADDGEVVTAGRLLTRVVANLVENGLKYSDGPVVVTASRDGADATVEVADDGGGFPDAALAQLFEPFTEAHADDHDGFGLGLFIVRELVDRNGGRIEVDSGPDGSTVTVHVPDLAADAGVR